MRLPLSLVLLALVACKKADQPAKQAPAAPAPAMDAAPVVTLPDAPAAPIAAAAPPASTDDALLDGLFADEGVAGYSAADHTVVYASRVTQEGTGTGLSIDFSTEGKIDSVDVYEPGDIDEMDAKIKAKRPELARRLAGKGFVVLARTAWPVTSDDRATPLGELALPGRTDKLRWKKGALALVGADGKVIVQPTLAKEPEETPSPSAIYAAPGVPVVLVELQWSPGDKYGEGFNAFTSMLVIALPAAP